MRGKINSCDPHFDLQFTYTDNHGQHTYITNNYFIWTLFCLFRFAGHVCGDNRGQHYVTKNDPAVSTPSLTVKETHGWTICKLNVSSCLTILCIIKMNTEINTPYEDTIFVWWLWIFDKTRITICNTSSRRNKDNSNVFIVVFHSISVRVITFYEAILR